MMKRIGHLFERVCSFENLYRAVLKARKGNLHNAASHRYFFLLEREILWLQEALLSDAYRPGAYFYFTINDPKERQIAVAPFRDRVVHHAIVAVLEPYYEKRFIHDSYACRKGKGTHKAIARAQSFLRKNRWFLKSDIDHFFDSVDHDILLRILHRKVKDVRLLNLIERIIRNGGVEEGKGLPIGNLTSQFFANLYLHELDIFIKQELRGRHYIRYMDDFVLFHEDKEWLKDRRLRIEDFLAARLQLSLKEKATFLNQRLNGLSFLGARVFPNTVRIKRENLNRTLVRLRQREIEYINGEIEEEQFQMCVASIAGHLEAFNTLELRKNIFKAYCR